MLPLLGIVEAGLRLADAIAERLPEPDPELRRMRVELRQMREEHRQERKVLAMMQQHERVMTRLRRRRGVQPTDRD